MVADIEKMKLKLGVMPKVSIKEGVQRLVNELVGTRPGGGGR
jgi:nucleoside-diphosphate-sugar epimerase